MVGLGLGSFFLFGRGTQVVAQAPSSVPIFRAIPATDWSWPSSGDQPCFNDLRNRNNPYLVVYQDRLIVFDRGTCRRVINPDDVLSSLAHLSRSAWPKGRRIVSLALEDDIDTIPVEKFSRVMAMREAVEKVLVGGGFVVDLVPSW
jgi:hypothetical protein